MSISLASSVKFLARICPRQIVQGFGTRSVCPSGCYGVIPTLKGDKVQSGCVIFVMIYSSQISARRDVAGL